MLFNSIHFLIFFLLVITLYFSIKHKYRWILLLISSYYFYMSFKLEYIILLMVSTSIAYIAGLQIYQSKTQGRKKLFLGLSILTNLGLLFGFKYFNFFSNSVREFLNLFSIPFHPITLKILLPLGLSFYTFKMLSYTFDVYRGKLEPQRHFGIFAVYVSYFPQLVAGPIERAGNLLPQLSEKHHFDYRQVTDGLKLMLWGFFKKLVIADRLTIVVDAVYNTPSNYTGTPLILATVFFAFQIYCDFSGYSDIAIGAAQVMGIRLMDNFNRPYFSRSISEFWRRWHISLSSWFKDYLYIPLGGNRVSLQRWVFNIFVVFLLSGLWHGANWTFVIWGALHGFYLVFGKITQNFRVKFTNKIGLNKVSKLHQLIQIGIAFILVDIGWIFFRANSLPDAVYIVTHLFSGISLSLPKAGLGGIGDAGLILCFLSIIFMEFVHLLQEHIGMRKFLSNKPLILRWSVYIIIILFILLFGVFKNIKFIYYQF